MGSLTSLTFRKRHWLFTCGRSRRRRKNRAGSKSSEELDLGFQKARNGGPVVTLLARAETETEILSDGDELKNAI
ncbi:hypothetical protein NL676_005461 [Syzygium grande]|nr:hypothetical protein NL676_005461 [Syzygium grande]